MHDQPHSQSKHEFDASEADNAKVAISKNCKNLSPAGWAEADGWGSQERELDFDGMI